MSCTIHAWFLHPIDGEKAAGALLDHGARPGDLSLIVSESYIKNDPTFSDSGLAIGEDGTPKTGITTTTLGDASSGAATGAGVGLGLGFIGALVVLTIPGFGLVIGGGALATALGSAAATMAAGAVAGGVTGYLKDQGVPEEHAVASAQVLTDGGAMLAVECPSGPLGHADIESMLAKYGAFNAQRLDGIVAIR